jgi:hypothetical protein
VVDAICCCVLFDTFLHFCSILYARFLKFLFVQFLTFINVFMAVIKVHIIVVSSNCFTLFSNFWDALTPNFFGFTNERVFFIK